MNPEVSVIMPVFNAEKYLKESINSIIDQSFTDFELIIVNDGSTDSSADIIKNIHDPRIKLISQNNKGVAHALNSGIRISKGVFIARMDADDISEKNRLKVQFDYLNKNPGTVLLGSNAIVVDMSGEYIYTSDIPLCWPEIKTGIPFFLIFHSSVMCRRDILIKAGLYDERVSNLNAFEDQLLWNKLINYGIIENIKEPLIKYRLQPNAGTGKSPAESLLAQKIIPVIVSGGFPQAEIEELLNLKRSMTAREKNYNYYSYIAKKYLFESRNRLNAFRSIFKAIRYRPFGYKLYLYMLCSLFPLSLFKKLKQISII